MITPFYFDEELFDDNSVREMPIISDSILNLWERYGCLAMSDDSIKEIRAALKVIPDKYKQKWITALTDFKTFKIDIEKTRLTDLEGITDFERKFYNNRVYTGLIANDFLDLFEEKSLMKEGNQLEIVSPNNLNESINFNNSAKYCESDIKANDDIDIVWNTRFCNIVRYSKKITVIDRYLAENLIRDFTNGNKSSLEWLVEKLSTYDTDYNLDIFSACDRRNSEISSADIRGFIDNTLKRKPYFRESQININFSLCKDRLFGEKAHDRMICIDEHVVQIGKGVDIFRDKIIENNTFTIKPKNVSLFQGVYRDLSRNREWRYL
ncbi:hypothetical protein [Pseudoalteromonas distincta]|uniref:hypothetical protein n=1 Tax=Pseudoalteromonas distincta TaxID=77608 RepID=UPI00241BEE82|nr:hypothetical protein [Pseudoalteromonas distincta]|tara:strand:- start:20258 stop:21226 length:969 start_codon:yes stop_codon:yes gene_type:complete